MFENCSLCVQTAVGLQIMPAFDYIPNLNHLSGMLQPTIEYLTTFVWTNDFSHM